MTSTPAPTSRAKPLPSEPLPCPWCGEKAEIFGGRKRAPDWEQEEAFVQCLGKGCGACGPFIDGERDAAITAWNTVASLRLALSEMERRVGELEAALSDAIRTWTFNHHQRHTHSWHDREDWFERHEVARALRIKEQLANGAPAAREEMENNK